jgi:trimethylguanosine synthase
VVADKYWAQRHRLFSKFDNGIELDRESWFSVTPEAIANHHATKITEYTNAAEGPPVVLDAFCGAGGNAIAFARHAKVSLVIAVDMDEQKLKMAARNAKIYEIPSDKLLLIHADALDVLSQYRNGTLTSARSSDSEQQQLVHGYSMGGKELLPQSIGLIFLSPPWGGEDYEAVGPKKFDLKCIQLGEVDGEELLRHAAAAISPLVGKIACFLPRNTNGYEVAKSALMTGLVGTMEVEQNLLNHKFKAITCYMQKKHENG